MDNTGTLSGKTILITGGAKRLGKAICLALAKDGADIILHYWESDSEAEKLADRIRSFNVNVYPVKADLRDNAQIADLIEITRSIPGLYGLVNNASVFGSLSLVDTDISAWNEHIQVNLTAPFVLSKALAKLPEGRIVNMLDWRALRPGPDHFPYTISKAGLAAMTRSLAIELAPRISVNGIALGAILPPEDSQYPSRIIEDVPAGRWANLKELTDTVKFMLTGPSYITGEIIHLDGGRHLV